MKSAQQWASDFSLNHSAAISRSVIESFVRDIQEDVVNNLKAHSGITPKQLETLEFIEGFIEKYKYAPSVQDIADGLFLKSKSGAHRLIVGLEERGFIRCNPNRARSIQLLRAA